MLKLIDVSIEFSMLCIHIYLNYIHNATSNKCLPSYNLWLMNRFNVVLNQLKNDTKTIQDFAVGVCHLYVCVRVFIYVDSFEREFFPTHWKSFNLDTMEWLSSDINFFSLSSILLTNF